MDNEPEAPLFCFTIAPVLRRQDCAIRNGRQRAYRFRFGARVFEGKIFPLAWIREWYRISASGGIPPRFPKRNRPATGRYFLPIHPSVVFTAGEGAREGSFFCTQKKGAPVNRHLKLSDMIQ
jgi:hypothetical protein